MTGLLFNLARLIQRLAEIYSLALMLYALLSWFPGGYQSGIGQFLAKICDPLLKKLQRFNLSIGYVDFTIVAAMIGVNFIARIISRIIYSLAGFGF
ncbi:YggT family protein [Vagococcus humatus]|uniref:YggT family protein n=1 Tax=Vagococcus humatus TaxID=1889241 RepID=A0A429Z703_9ENTE|nr:YggT family protein [Vagococcus humatus]RST89471.1 YggT family protein [Vagococcus humatus]